MIMPNMGGNTSVCVYIWEYIFTVLFAVRYNGNFIYEKITLRARKWRLSLFLRIFNNIWDVSKEILCARKRN